MMSLLKREPAREPTPVQRIIDDPDTGSIKRRHLRRVAAGIKAIGPNGPPQPRPEAPRAFVADTPEHIEHVGGIVAAELHEIDKHRQQIEQRLVGGPDPAVAQELAAERRQLAALAQMIAADLEGPVRDRDGRPLADEMRAFLRARTRELREQSWRASAQAAAEGDHRRARRHRVDALRSRHRAEHEAALRPSLPGYSTPWN